MSELRTISILQTTGWLACNATFPFPKQKNVLYKNTSKFLTKEHSIPKMELFIPLFVGALYCSSFTVSYQQGHKVQQCFAIDWSSTIPDDLVTIDLDSPIGYISIDHWLYMIDHQWQCITVDWSSTRPDALLWSLARA